jgi:hypothetical protein
MGFLAKTTKEEEGLNAFPLETHGYSQESKRFD